MFNKWWRLMLSIILVFTMSPLTILAQTDGSSQFSDMPDDWSRQALENAVKNGLMFGSDGKIYPKKLLKRAELAAMINRAFGARAKAPIDRFTDVAETAWYYDDMAKAVKMKTFQGNANKLYPEDPITREEAFAVIARAMKLPASDAAPSGFSDLDDISPWARGEVYSLIHAGYVKGANGKILPKRPISRAEFAQLMDNIIKVYIRQAGVYDEVAEGNVMVNVPGVTLKDLTVNGDLIIGDGVGDGDVVLENVQVSGRLVVRGGGENSIVIRGDSRVSTVIVAKVDGAVRVLTADGAEVETVLVDDGDDRVILEGAIGTVVINVSSPVELNDAVVGSVVVEAPEAEVVIGTGTVVENVVIESAASAATLQVEGTVGNVTVEAPMTAIAGTGTVENVNVRQGANQTKIETQNTRIVIDEGVQGTTGAGGAPLEAGEHVNSPSTDSDATPVPPPGGGTPVFIPLSAVSVTGEAVVGATLTAAVTPSAATVNFQWLRADAADGEYTNIVGATNNTYDLAAEDEGKYIKVRATGTGLYTGTVESGPLGPVRPAPDTTAPQLISVSPTPGNVYLEYGETFKLEVTAFDENLRELEVDHNIDDLPEFSVYASETDPYDGEGDAFDQAGVKVTFNADEQKWTIDFGTAVTGKIVANGGITFYLVLLDEAGNQWGSMDPTAPENTFAYTVTQQPEKSTYAFSYQTPDADVEVGTEVTVPVTLATKVKGAYGYEGVRFKFAAQGPAQGLGNVTFKAKDHNNTEHTFTNEGYWGPSGGFDLPAEYSATTNWTLVFSAEGKYTITFSLIDAVTDDVIAGIEESVIVNVVRRPGAFGNNAITTKKHGAVDGYIVDIRLTGGVTFENARVEVSLLDANDQVMQKNILKENHGLTSTSLTVPFDVKGTFDYVADGFWEVVDGKSVKGNFDTPAKVVIKVTLANGKVLVDELTGITPVKKEYHTYKFNIENQADKYIVGDGPENPNETNFNDLTPVKLSIAVDEEKDMAYEGMVRVAPVGASNLQLWAKSTSGKWTDINQAGWGPAGGFPINLAAVTEVYVIATGEFDGKVTIKLVDISGNYGAEDNIIISQEFEVYAVSDEVAAALDAVNDAERENMLTVLNTHATALALNFGNLTEGGRRLAVADAVYFVREAVYNNKYRRATDIKAAFDEAVETETLKMELIRLVNETNTEHVAAELDRILAGLKAYAEALLNDFDRQVLDNYYGENFSADLEAAIVLMGTYLDLEPTDKQQVAETFMDNDYTGSFTEVMEYLLEAIYLLEAMSPYILPIFD